MMLMLLHLLSKNELSLPSFSAKAAAAAGCEKAASSPLTILCYSTRAPRLSNTLFLCFNRLLLPSPRNNACLSVCIFPGFFLLKHQRENHTDCETYWRSRESICWPPPWNPGLRDSLRGAWPCLTYHWFLNCTRIPPSLCSAQ